MWEETRPTKEEKSTRILSKASKIFIKLHNIAYYKLKSIDVTALFKSENSIFPFWVLNNVFWKYHRTGILCVCIIYILFG